MVEQAPAELEVTYCMTPLTSVSPPAESLLPHERQKTAGLPADKRKIRYRCVYLDQVSFQMESSGS